MSFCIFIQGFSVGPVVLDLPQTYTFTYTYIYDRDLLLLLTKLKSFLRNHFMHVSPQCMDAVIKPCSSLSGGRKQDQPFQMPIYHECIQHIC